MNSIIKVIQSGLIGFVLCMVGYSYKTAEFWIVMIIMSLQWLKEQKNEHKD